MTYDITMIIGNRGTGKTGTLIREIVPEYIAIRKGNFKIGVFDLEDNYNYNSFECIQDPKYSVERKKLLQKFVFTPVPVFTRERFAKVTRGMVRILPQANENGGEFTRTAIKDIVYNQNIKECMIVVEDSARFMPDNNSLDSTMRDIIINAKQRRMNLVLMFHFWTDVPPKLLKWIDTVYLHKCDETVMKRAKDIVEIKLQKILAAEKKLTNNRNRYAFEKIKLN